MCLSSTNPEVENPCYSEDPLLWGQAIHFHDSSRNVSTFGSDKTHWGEEIPGLWNTSPRPPMGRTACLVTTTSTVTSRVTSRVTRSWPKIRLSQVGRDVTGRARSTRHERIDCKELTTKGYLLTYG